MSEKLALIILLPVHQRQLDELRKKMSSPQRGGPPNKETIILAAVAEMYKREFGEDENATRALPDEEAMIERLREKRSSWWPTGRPTQSEVVREAIVEMYNKQCGDGDG